MRNRHYLPLLFSVVLLACEPGQDPAKLKLQNEVTALEQRVAQPASATDGRDAALLLAQKAVKYAQDFPQDTLAATLLFKAAQAAKGVKEYGKAVELWGQVWRDYGKHRLAAAALFEQASTFANDLDDKPMAAKYFKKLISQYQNDTVLAARAKQQLSGMGQQPMQLMRQIETE